MLLAAPPAEEGKIWKELEKALEFKDPPEALQRYLGAIHNMSKDQKLVKMEVGTESMLSAALRKFEEEHEGCIRTVSTPFITDDVLCGDKNSEENRNEIESGKFSESAASHVASLLYIARMARPDLLVAVTRLTRYVSKWTRIHDVALIRLFGYIKGSLGHRLKFQLERGKPFESHVWSDADLCGDPTDTKSTSGVWVELRSVGSDACWPIAWASKRQGASAFSTCESEVVAMSFALREEGLPLLNLVATLIGHDVSLICKEDNQQAIAAINRGYSKKLRHIPRVHKVSSGALHESLAAENRIGRVEYHPTDTHRADIFTKSLERGRFESCCKLIGLESCSGEGGVEETRGRVTYAQLSTQDGDTCLCMDRDCESCGQWFC
eukprot:6476389-Amphidinium_carterae.3